MIGLESPAGDGVAASYETNESIGLNLVSSRIPCQVISFKYRAVKGDNYNVSENLELVGILPDNTGITNYVGTRNPNCVKNIDIELIAHRGIYCFKLPDSLGKQLSCNPSFIIQVDPTVEDLGIRPCDRVNFCRSGRLSFGLAATAGK
jgi:hypothetical protein